MRRIAIFVAVLGMSLCAWGQGGAGQTAPAAQGKRPPQAKTQDEYKAYVNVTQTLKDPAEQEKAADDFVAKFSNSELRAWVYKQGPMHGYQRTHNDDKVLEMARKVLIYDGDDPEALLVVAQIVSDKTRDTDLDKDQKVAEAKKDAERALVTVDTDVPTTGYPPEQLAAFKATARSEAYEILGVIAFNANKWPEAETNLRKSIDALPEQPDPLVVYKLAVALDMQDRVPEAMKYADQAVNLTKDQPDSGVGKAARDEKDRLVKLNSGTAPGQTTPK